MVVALRGRYVHRRSAATPIAARPANSKISDAGSGTLPLGTAFRDPLSNDTPSGLADRVQAVTCSGVIWTSAATGFDRIKLINDLGGTRYQIGETGGKQLHSRTISFATKGGGDSLWLP